MNERLEKLCFLPPPADTPWSGPPRESTRGEIKRVDGQTIEIDVPLFWYDPPWHRLDVETADAVAVAVGRLGVCVSALRSDLAGAGQPSNFHQVGRQEDQAANDERQPSASLPRIVPYRPERYGLSDRDFDGARIIDVRLTMNRDQTGRFAFSPEQIERWEATPTGEPLAGGGWVPAATFPPDVVSMQHLSSKLNQLRALSPTAAVFVSVGLYRLDEELAEIIAAKPDGLILRLDDVSLDGLQLALITRHTQQKIHQAGNNDLPLWIVPGKVTPDDAVKLIALGASAVAIDMWCADVVDATETQHQESSAARLGYSSPTSRNADYLFEIIEDELGTRMERFKGLLNSIQYLPPRERLGSVSEKWGRALGVRTISFPFVADKR